MIYPSSISALIQELTEAPQTEITTIAQKLIEGAMGYDAQKARKVIDNNDYHGFVRRDFNGAVEYTADAVFGASWADVSANAEEVGEFWNKGRRASLTGHEYIFDENSLPLNPFLKTGIKGRGVLGSFGPNHVVDIGILDVRLDEAGKPALYAWGILKKDTPAICGGYTQYKDKDENGFVTNKEIWSLNQTKEFFEEMVSGSILLDEESRKKCDIRFEDELKKRILARGGKELSEELQKELRAQIETEVKLYLVQQKDPEFLRRLFEFFKTGTECFKGPLQSSNTNTDNAWMETYFSWVYMDEKKWDELKGKNPAFDYALLGGDDADGVAAHRIDKDLVLKSANAAPALSPHYADPLQPEKGSNSDRNLDREILEAGIREAFLRL